jgi:hypothetical protein
MITALAKESGILNFFNSNYFFMLGAVAISHLLMPAPLTLLDYQYLCLWRVQSNNKSFKKVNPVN